MEFFSKRFVLLKITSCLLLIFLIGCESTQLNILEQPNPYAQHGIGVEGYMGAAMTSCLGMPPSGPPVQKRLKSGTVINGPASEQKDYFDCIDSQIMESEMNQRDEKSK
jgi:hypothetical protein